MVIKGAKTIAEYKEIRDKNIQKWIDDRFVEGAVTWQWVSANKIEIQDKTGDTIQISLDQISERRF